MSVVIYNCRLCKLGLRVEYSAGRESNGHSSWPFRLDESGRRQFPGALVVGVRRNGSSEYGGDPLALCRECGMPMAWGALEACRRPEVPCDERCTHARGHKCDCSCGGTNHGRGWQIGSAGLFTGPRGGAGR